jgi:hypothetical protein
MYDIRFLLLEMLELVCEIEFHRNIFNRLLGKTQIWKTLFKTYQNMKRRPHAIDRRINSSDDFEI